jgi:hypothetical protein
VLIWEQILLLKEKLSMKTVYSALFMVGLTVVRQDNVLVITSLLRSYKKAYKRNNILIQWKRWIDRW